MNDHESAKAMPTIGEIGRRSCNAYNAELVEVVEIHEGLRILRVRPDGGPISYRGGQHTVLGLGAWEKPIVGGPQWPIDAGDRRIIKRAYSFSSPILDGGGTPTVAAANGLIEFYVTLVPATAEHPPGLTPRLFALAPGDRLLVGDRATGHYTLGNVRLDGTIVFAATGTGEAPHNAMLAELLAAGHRGPIVSLVCVRLERDLGYLATHRRVESRWPNYRYVPLTTREPRNVDATAANYVGKRYVQDVFESAEIDALTGGRLGPSAAQVFLCGNPAMLGLPRREGPGSDKLVYPRPRGMAELLVERGFTPDTPTRRGNVHFERYW
ncbi:MAG: ferredoxin--NADP reductase [Pirellulales bacterium]